MSNLNILGMSSITNSGTLEVMVADPNNPTLDIRTTLPTGGGAPTIAAGSLFGNPGTTAGAGVDITIGSNLSLNSGGTLNATGGGGGSYVGNPTLGVTIVGSGPGTIETSGYIIPQIVDANASTLNPLGISLQGGAVTNVSGASVNWGGGGFYNKGGNASGSGTPSGGPVEIHGGKVFLSGPGTATSGHAYIDATGAYVAAGPNNGAVGAGAELYAQSATVTYGGVITGGAAQITGGNATGVAAGNTVNAAGVTLSPGVALGSGTLTHGALYFNLPVVGSGWGVKNLDTVDPHVLGRIFQTSVAAVGYVLVPSQG